MGTDPEKRKIRPESKSMSTVALLPRFEAGQAASSRSRRLAASLGSESIHQVQCPEAKTAMAWRSLSITKPEAALSRAPA